MTNSAKQDRAGRMDDTDCPAAIKESEVSRRRLALRIGDRDCIAENAVSVSSSCCSRRCRFAMKGGNPVMPSECYDQRCGHTERHRNKR